MMLVDAQLKPSRWQPLVHGLALAVITVAILVSGLAWAISILMSVFLLLVGRWWYLNITIKQSPQQLWQEDHYKWCWKMPYSPEKLQTGQIIRLHDLGSVIVLCMQRPTGQMRLVVWRDQMKLPEWQKLKVIANLSTD